MLDIDSPMEAPDLPDRIPSTSAESADLDRGPAAPELPSSVPPPSDAELEALFEALHPVLVSYASRRLGTARRWIDAQDLVQQVLIEYRLRAGQAGVPRDLERARGWLQRRIGWRIVGALRDHGRLRGETELGDPNATPALSPTDGAVTRGDTRRLVRDLVEALPPAYADVVRLCALEEFSTAEAALALELPEDTVRKRYSRARSLLAARLEGLREA